jgi:hypothetical protein
MATWRMVKQRKYFVQQRQRVTRHSQRGKSIRKHKHDVTGNSD